MPLSVVNDHTRIQLVYNESQEYLNGHSDLRDQIAAHLWAYNEVQDLIPFTVAKLDSGHLFPYSESHYELESSFELCRQGFYRHSFIALRSVLELGRLSLHFDKEGYPDALLQRWLRSQAETPWFKKQMLKGLFELEYFHEFDAQFSLRKEIEDLYNRLSNHVHVRGYYFSSRRHSRGNANCFNESSLHEYVKLMTEVVEVIMTMMLLKYPIGMQRLPLFGKYGFNPPVGGLLDEDSQPIVVAVLDEGVRGTLQRLSDNDPDVQEMVRHVHALPDLTEEQLEAQYREAASWNGGATATDGAVERRAADRR